MIPLLDARSQNKDNEQIRAPNIEWSQRRSLGGRDGTVKAKLLYGGPSDREGDHDTTDRLRIVMGALVE